MAEVFFLRSPVAHGKIRSITVPEAARGQVFFASDIAFTKPIVAVSAAKGFKPSNYPALTSDKARFVGDILAMCIAPTRAEAEDIAQSCVIDFEELPAIWDIDIALKPDAPRVHDHWSDNVYIESRIATGDLDAGPRPSPMSGFARACGWVGMPASRWRAVASSRITTAASTNWWSTVRRSFRTSSAPSSRKVWASPKASCGSLRLTSAAASDLRIISIRRSWRSRRCR